MTTRLTGAEVRTRLEPDVRREHDLELLRRYEPVIRYTRGELFLPMAVEDYIACAALFRRNGKSSEQLVAKGGLDTATLAALGRDRYGETLYLRYVEEPLTRKAYREWRRRPDRVRFTGSSGAAAVGLLARVVAALMRLSLLLRGKVPGGYAAAAQCQASASPRGPHYYGHVTRDGGYAVLQYWFLYAMNDWRSTFGGVNDHEADWEQVTIFIVENEDGSTTPAWVAFSSHDETGNDLRRRWDDPDMERVGEHPVVYAGAGSHSGAYLKGEYLVSVAPDLPRWVEDVRRIFTRVIPWAERDSAGIGIPYIDYRRGDGPGVGPGQDHEWVAVLIDDTTEWVRDYRGLWGLDTRDPLGGERAPAGPRYERDQRVRQSWAQPVGWAALDAEPPTVAAAETLLEIRRAQLQDNLSTVDAELAIARDELRAARAVDQATGRPPLRPSAATKASFERVAALRADRARLQEQLEAARAAKPARLGGDGVHAHLRHRALPLHQAVTRHSGVVRVWASASDSILLAALGLILLLGNSALLEPALVLVAAMLLIEATLRGRLLQLLAGVVAAAFVVVAVSAVVAIILGNVRVGAGVLLLFAAAYMATQTVTDALRRR